MDHIDLDDHDDHDPVIIQADLEDFLRQEPAQQQPDQQDLFVITDTVSSLPVKDDMSSMEFPLFSLSKNKDTEIRTYSRGGRTVKVIPSVVGSANQFDKDLLIYAISQLVRHHEMGQGISRRIRIEVTQFLKGTRRSTGGAAYKRVIDMCRRLKGTTIETNVKTTDEERTRGFSMIEDYEITKSTKDGQGALEVEVTISKWLFRAVEQRDVLTLDPGYFELGQSLERRIYELARKHCGNQPLWKVGIDVLQDKSGSRQASKYFAADMRKMAKSKNFPDYVMLIDDSAKPSQVVFVTRDAKKLNQYLTSNGLTRWYYELMQKNAQDKLI